MAGGDGKVTVARVALARIRVEVGVREPDARLAEVAQRPLTPPDALAALVAATQACSVPERGVMWGQSVLLAVAAKAHAEGRETATLAETAEYAGMTHKLAQSAADGVSPESTIATGAADLLRATEQGIRLVGSILQRRWPAGPRPARMDLLRCAGEVLALLAAGKRP